MIAALFDNQNGAVNYRGEYFDIESAKLWDLPDERVPIGIAVSGPDSCELAGRKAEMMIAVQPNPSSASCSTGRGRRQVPGRPGRDRIRQGPGRRGPARPRAVSLVRARLEGQRRPPQPRLVRRRDAIRHPGTSGRGLSCGPDVEDHVEAIKAFVEAVRRGRDRADRRRAAGGVHEVGRARIPARVALALAPVAPY